MIVDGSYLLNAMHVAQYACKLDHGRPEKAKILNNHQVIVTCYAGPNGHEHVVSYVVVTYHEKAKKK